MNQIPIWRIKYLPRTLDEFCGRGDVRSRLKEVINHRNFPHLLFIGAEGIGKTMLATLFSREFLGNSFNANFKLVYANVPLSEEERKEARSSAYVSKSKIGSTAGRRITTPAFIKVKVKPFVQLKVLGGAPFKILIVKNFEALGANQQGFRRLMEIYGSNCRMILITTKISGVIDPIVSRCQLFLISQVKFESFNDLMLSIAKEEELEIEEEVIKVLYKISEGKLSRAIDLLQLSSTSGKQVDLVKLHDSSRKFKDGSVKELLLTTLKGEFLAARDLSRSIISTYKYNSHDLFQHLLSDVMILPLSKFTRSILIELISNADFRALDGQDTDIQVSTLLAKMCALSGSL